ncbi:MAG: hypothetical protein ABJC26_15460 [Gemmatimonadaceae bacterium]
MTWLLMRHSVNVERALLFMPIALASLLWFPDFGILTGAMLLLLSTVVLRQRSNGFEAALPISARKIFGIQLGVALLFVMIPLTIWAIVIQLKSRDVTTARMVTDFIGTEGWSTPRIIQLFCGMFIAVVLPYTVHARRFTMPPGWTYIALWFSIGLVTALVVKLLSSTAAAVALGAFAVTLALVTYRVVPESFQKSSLKLRDDGKVATNEMSPIFSMFDFTHAWRWSFLKSAIQIQVLVFAVIFLGMSSFGKMSLLYFSILVSSGYSLIRERTRWLRALPIAHRTRLLIPLVPVLALGVLVPLTGLRIPNGFGNFERSLFYGAPATYKHGERYFDSPTKVPLQYWHRAPNNVAPTITAPWGETSPAYTFQGPGLVLYNPYSSIEGSSERFIDWQFARATIAVYGKAIPRSEYDYEKFPLPRPLVEVFPVRLLDALMLTLYALFIAFVSGFGYKPRFANNSAVQMLTPFLAISPGFIGLAIDWYYGMAAGAEVITPFSHAFFMEWLRRWHAYQPFVFVVAFIPVAILYVLLEQQFARSEMPKLLVKQVK